MRLDEIVDSFQLMSGEPGLVISECYFPDSCHPKHECSIRATLHGKTVELVRFDPILQNDGDCAYRMGFRTGDSEWVVIARSSAPFVAIQMYCAPIILRPSGRICELNHMGVVNT